MYMYIAISHHTKRALVPSLALALALAQICYTMKQVGLYSEHSKGLMGQGLRVG